MLKQLIDRLISRSGDDAHRSGKAVAAAPETIATLLQEGVNFQKAGDFAASERVYLKVLEGSPGNPDALNLLANVVSLKGEFDNAESLARRAVAAHPDIGDFHNTLGHILLVTGRPEEAVSEFRSALRTDPDAMLPRSNLLFALNLLPDANPATLFAEHREWAKRHADPLLARGHAAVQRRDEPHRRLRLGYVSADFRSHPVGRIMTAVLGRHDPSRFDVICFDNTAARDQLNARLRSLSGRWIDINCLDDKAVADRVREIGIDILVDLSGHTRNNRLLAFARRPAPVQVTWLGYLSSTGMGAMDWRITEMRLDPAPAAAGVHSERLWYLPDCLWPWVPPDTVDAVSIEAPCMRAGFVTFGSFNHFQKLNERVFAAWAKILQGVPDSRLRLYGAPGAGSVVDRVYGFFETAGVAAERVDLFGPVPHEEYMRAYREVDIALDPFPYSGGVTTCESLWMGVPVIALAGTRGFARTSASMLGAAGLDELVVQDHAGYLAKAVQLAVDRARVCEYRRTLRSRVASSPLADIDRFVRNLEAAYLGIWQS